MQNFLYEFLWWLGRGANRNTNTRNDSPLVQDAADPASDPVPGSGNSEGGGAESLLDGLGAPGDPGLGDSQSPKENGSPLVLDTFDFVETFEVDRPMDLSEWTGAQLVRGQLSMVDDPARSGDTVLFMEADNNIGKSHIFKAGYWVDEGDQAQVASYVYIPSGGSLKNLYIMDWESKSVWSDENSLPNTQPGIRIGFFGRDGDIAVERGKMGIASEADFRNADFVMPRDQWVKFEWRLTAGVGDKGSTQVYVNDTLVIDARGTTYIDEEVADQSGILLNDDYAFDRFKIGITANSTTQDIEMMIDDVSIHTWDAAETSAGWLVV